VPELFEMVDSRVVRPQADRRTRTVGGFLFRLETVDGAAAEPPTLASAVPNWAPGDTIPLDQRTLRVIGTRDDAVQPPLLVVEETS
jgi:hypothetical protein